ncbi:MAG: alcohol dehydrogenase catalytic domain-containing protein [Actinomycetota bacterium]|nr:alcohol dehydrogenase catalytic domain-containing protein [Actinomycetota bacterium]
MRAVRFDAFGAAPYIADVDDPVPPEDGVVIDVSATGLCRSDWHGWQGHDPDITVLPHVPGHEFAGVVSAVGRDVRRWRVGDRVTVPFICSCGTCGYCLVGDGQVCPDQWQPGFSGPGSFAERVAIPRADANLVALPDAVDDATAASLGCRFATAYRAVRHVARVQPGEVVAVLGCGGVGLSAVMVAVASGAMVIAVDVHPGAREQATALGAAAVIDPATGDVAGQVRTFAPGGADVGIDALGSAVTAAASVASLRPRGRHVQVGLLPPAVVRGTETIPMHLVVSRELAVLGSHGMAAAGYPQMLAEIAAGTMRPAALVARTIGLESLPGALAAMGAAHPPGVTVCLPRSDAR